MTQQTTQEIAQKERKKKENPIERSWILDTKTCKNSVQFTWLLSWLSSSWLEFQKFFINIFYFQIRNKNVVGFFFIFYFKLVGRS